MSEPARFDIARLLAAGMHGYGGTLGLRYHAHGPDWARRRAARTWSAIPPAE